MRKRAEIYHRRACYFLHPSSRTVDGFWVLTEPCVKLPDACSDAELGDAAVAALGASRNEVPNPPRGDTTSVLGPLLRAAGVKSWSSFAKGTSSVDLRDEGGRISIIPYQNREPRDGFRPDDANAIVIDREAGAALGARIREAFRRATGR
jgi:hypothetical protein